jgi:hypothetical protein
MTPSSFITPPEMTRRLRVLILTFALAACRESSTTVSNQPHAADHYARLLRRQLTDSDPKAVQQAITCEMGRIDWAFGGDESRRRLKPVRDSVFRRVEDRRRFNEIDSMLAGQTFEVNGTLCDSLNALANREVPLTPIPAGLGRPLRQPQ